MTVDSWGFNEERQAIARRARSRRMRLGAIRTAVFGGLAVALVVGGASALRDLIASRGWPGWATVVTFLAALFAIFALAEFPFNYIAGFRWEREIDLSTQTRRGWLKDLAKSYALGLGSALVVGGVLLWLLATTLWWWIVAWILGITVSAVLGFLTPIVFVPLFFRFRPLQDERLRTRFEALATRARVPVLGVFELEASSKTRRSNAAVMGFGRTRRILVTDTLLRDFPADEVDTILAHELAHQRHLDPLRGFLGGSAVSLAVVAIAAWLYATLHTSFGVTSMADMAGLPLLVVLFSLVALLFRPAELRWSRARESRADRFSLTLTRNAEAFASAMVRLHDRNLGVANPGRLERWLFYSHPTGRERVEAARAFRASGP